jgi:uncharacterized phage protein gp47/JayE
MADLPTRTDLFDTGAREAIARSNARAPGKRLSPQAIYTEGSDINILLAAGSAMAEEVLRQASRADADKWLDSSREEALDRLILDRTSRECVRKGAAPAYVPLTFLRLEGPLAAFNISAGRQVKTAQQVAFELMSPVAFSAGFTGPLTVTGRAVLAGTEANVAIGTVTELDASPDPNLSVTNLDFGSGGYDREPDSAYRERGRAFFRSARRGTIPAVELGARSVAGIAFATVEEELDAEGVQTGNVFVYVGDVNGQANQALVAQVRDGLLEYRAGGVVPVIVGAVPEYIEIAFRPRFVAGYDPAAVLAQLRFATVALVNQTDPNKPVQYSLLQALARRVPGLVVLDDLIANPTGDVYPSAPGRVLRTTPDRVSLAVPA